MSDLVATIGGSLDQILAVVIPLIVATSVWLAGDKKTVSWPLGIFAHAITGVYAVVSHHWGWLLGPILVAPVFARNWIKWHKEQRQPKPIVLRELTEDEVTWVINKVRQVRSHECEVKRGVGDD